MQLDSLLKTRPMPKSKDRDVYDAKKAALISNSTTEAVAYALFWNNLIFILSFLLLAFSLIPKIPMDIPTEYQLGGSVFIPAAVLYLNTHDYIHI